MLETVADLAAAGVGNFDELSTDDLREFFIGVVSRSIEGKILNEVGTNAVSVPADIAGVERAQNMLHDFVEGCVRDEFEARGSDLGDLDGDAIDGFVDDLYAAALDLVEALGEEWMRRFSLIGRLGPDDKASVQAGPDRLRCLRDRFPRRRAANGLWDWTGARSNRIARVAAIGACDRLGPPSGAGKRRRHAGVAVDQRPGRLDARDRSLRPRVRAEGLERGETEYRGAPQIPDR